MQCLELEGRVKIWYHKTWEIVKIINKKCDLIITMNITKSLAKSLIDRNKTRVYFVSCSRDINDIAKERYFLGCSHLKLYRTDDKVFISTSNLSLSSWDELTVELARNEKLDMFISEIERNLRLKNDFIKEFW
jgi:hypothetical protein